MVHDPRCTASWIPAQTTVLPACAACARTAGLGGRSRHPGSIAEGAWLNVTRAVRSAILRIATPDPELATHLEATVRTGTVCVHSPDPRAPMGWRVSVAPVHRG